MCSIQRADEIELQILYKSDVYPIGYLAQNSDKQVLFAFKIHGWHLTLHKEKDGSILRTLFDPKKRRNSIDHQYAETARTIGYNDPDRHGNYIAHSPLIKFHGHKGYHLVNIKLTMSSLSPKNKLNARKRVYLKTSEPAIDLEFNLVTEDETIDRDSAVIPTKFGILAISLYPWSRCYPIGLQKFSGWDSFPQTNCSMKGYFRCKL